LPYASAKATEATAPETAEASTAAPSRRIGVPDIRPKRQQVSAGFVRFRSAFMTTNVNVRRTAMVINIDLDLAVAFYETFFPSGQDATLIARVNRSDFYPAFNIVSDSLGDRCRFQA
jgi:hypothetical protein